MWRDGAKFIGRDYNNVRECEIKVKRTIGNLFIKIVVKLENYVIFLMQERYWEKNYLPNLNGILIE